MLCYWTPKDFERNVLCSHQKANFPRLLPAAPPGRSHTPFVDLSRSTAWSRSQVPHSRSGAKPLCFDWRQQAILIHAVTLMYRLASQTQPVCMHHFQHHIWSVLFGSGLQDKHRCCICVYSSWIGDRVEQDMIKFYFKSGPTKNTNFLGRHDNHQRNTIMNEVIWLLMVSQL